MLLSWYDKELTGSNSLGFNEIIGQHPPAWYDWLKAALCVVIHLMFVEIFKMFYRTWSKKSLQDKPHRMFYNDL